MIISVVIALTNPTANKTRLMWVITIIKQIINNILHYAAKVADAVVWFQIDKLLGPFMRSILDLMNKLAEKPTWCRVTCEWLLVVPVLVLGLIHSPLIAWKKYRKHTRVIVESYELYAYAIPHTNPVNWKQEGF